MLNHKPFWVYAVLIILASVIIAFVISLFVSWYMHIPLSSIGVFSLFVKPTPSKMDTTTTVNKNTLMVRTPYGYANKATNGVTKTEIKNGGYYYDITGVFADVAYYHDDFLHVEFIIDGDPYKKRIPIMFTYKTGNLYIGHITTSKDSWNIESTETLKGLIKPQGKGILRLTFLNQKLQGNDAQEKQFLENILNGQWPDPGNMIFQVEQVGFLE